MSNLSAITPRTISKSDFAFRFTVHVKTRIGEKQLTNKSEFESKLSIIQDNKTSDQITFDQIISCVGQNTVSENQNGKEKPFSCEYCNKNFTNSNNLKRHERIHTGEKPFACMYCDKKFSQQASKKMHERIHTGEKPFACMYCDKKFTLSANQKKHEMIHTGEKPRKSIACGRCKKRFLSPNDLKSHERRKTLCM